MAINQNKKLMLIVIIIVILAIIGLIVFGLNFMLNKKEYRLDNPGEELGYDIPVGNLDLEVTESLAEGRNLSNELKILNGTYSTAKAWLKIPGTSIDTPIFQSTNNTRFYRNDRDNHKTKWGESYLDYRCDVNDFSNMSHIIIYGHNTETDSRFTPLLNYKKQEFYQKHPTIELATANGNYKFEIFSVYVTDTTFFYLDTNFANAEEYTNFINSIKGKSKYNTKINVNAGDTILTLSTCDYSIKDGRFVVHARLIK